MTGSRKNWEMSASTNMTGLLDEYMEEITAWTADFSALDEVGRVRRSGLVSEDAGMGLWTMSTGM